MTTDGHSSKDLKSTVLDSLAVTLFSTLSHFFAPTVVSLTALELDHWLSSLHPTEILEFSSSFRQGLLICLLISSLFNSRLLQNLLSDQFKGHSYSSMCYINDLQTKKYINFAAICS